MARRTTKAVALTVAAGLITWGVQTATTSDIYAGGIAAVIGLVVMVGYQFAEESDHAQVYNDVVESIGEDNLRALSEASGDELRELLEDVRRTPPGE